MSLPGMSTTSEYVTIIPGDIRNHKNKKYKKICHDLGITEILFGLVSILLSIGTLVCIERSSIWNNNITHMATGVWCGTMLAISGSLGIFSKSRNSKTLLNANLMMSVIAAIFMALQFVVSVVACLSSTGNSPLVTLHAFLALVAFTSLVICALHASYTCAAKCCFPWLSTGRVMYHGLPGQYIQLDNGQTLLLQNRPIDVATCSHYSPAQEPPKHDDNTGLPPAYSE